jgi:ZIP family zinc transporter
MSATKIALLGAIAGFTIFLGLPVGRLRNPAPRLRALLNAGAVGILVFLLWDVLAHAWEPIDGALGDHRYGAAAGNGVVMAAGLGAGLLGLVYFDRWVAHRGGAARPVVVPAPEPVAVTAGGVADRAAAPLASPPATAGWRSPAGQLALMIAAGIGLHNFAEGLAIGNSAASGEIALAVLLIVGFGLHNATEGFGIVAPLAAAGIRPSWGYLTVLGLIGGGPTFLGTLVGQRFADETVAVAFLSLAAGSILYVVIELLAVARKMGVKELATWGLLIGLLAGFLTDAIVTAGGA